MVRFYIFRIFEASLELAFKKKVRDHMNKIQSWKIT